MSPHAQSCGLPDACAERLWYNDLDALAPPCMLTVRFSYFTSSTRVFATFPHTLKSSHPQLDACLNMKTSETKLQALIEGTKQYIVPLFQRPYSWDKKEWEMLWNDL